MAGDCIRLTAVERVKIELGLRDGLSLTAIAAELGRPKGTMSKEIARNGGRDTYDAGAAHIRMENAPRGGRRNRLSPGEPLFEAVACLLRKRAISCHRTILSNVVRWCFLSKLNPPSLFLGSLTSKPTAVSRPILVDPRSQQIRPPPFSKPANKEPPAPIWRNRNLMRG